MQQELANSNHSPGREASWPSPAQADVLEKLGPAFGNCMLYSGDDLRRLAEEQAELRRLRALADELRLKGAAPADTDSRPPHLWTVRQFAKQAGISEKAARPLVRKLGGFCAAQSHCCSCPGGKRGCDYRLAAARGAAWVNSQRWQRAAR